MELCLWIVASVALALWVYFFIVRWRNSRRDPFLVDLKALTTKYTIKRAGAEDRVLCITLLEIMEIMTGEGKSIEHMAHDLTALMHLELDPISELEMRLIVACLNPSLAVLEERLKKVLPLGSD